MEEQTNETLEESVLGGALTSSIEAMSSCEIGSQERKQMDDEVKVLSNAFVETNKRLDDGFIKTSQLALEERKLELAEKQLEFEIAKENRKMELAEKQLDFDKSKLEDEKGAREKITNKDIFDGCVKMLPILASIITGFIGVAGVLQVEQEGSVRSKALSTAMSMFRPKC